MKSQAGPRTVARQSGPSPLVGALHSLLDPDEAAGSVGPPYPHLHLFLCQGNDLPILVSQLSWNSRVGNFISMAEFGNNSSDTVQVVNGLYRHHSCSPQGFSSHLQPSLYWLLWSLQTQCCAPHVTTLVDGRVFQEAGLGEVPFISPADPDKLSGLTLLSFINQRQVGNYRL